MSRRIALALSFLLLLPAIATVAAPPPSHPNISTPTIYPTSPGAGDQVTVNMTVTANAGIQNVTVHYTTNNWSSNTTVVASYNSTTHLALAHIPPLYSGGTVKYFIVAYDNNGNKGTNDNGGNYYTYTVAAPTLSSLTSMWIELAMVMTAILAAVSIGVYSLRHKPTTH
ncbi:hypothetical protein J2P12_08085 [Candidatus Bathyarchaeota archaeon]|nr:hypothetical protein [Candidatus Bathyarchaeota archaeon]